MKTTNAIVKELCPIIDKAFSNSAILNNYKKLVGQFIADRANDIYDYAPMNRIYFTDTDYNNLFDTIKIEKDKVKDILSRTYYAKISNFHPSYAKDEFTILALSVFRYFFLKNKDKKLIEMSLMHLIYSGKMYPSVHYSSFPKAQPSENAHIMNYVVNKRMTDQFDLKSEGSVNKALLVRSESWYNAYKDKIKEYEDDDIVYIIQQFRDRMKNFMQNIAELYYEVYDNKQYLSFDSDDISDDSYRLADSNSLKIERYVENTMNEITGKGINKRLVLLAKNEYVKTEELSSILETIIDDKQNVSEIRELLSILISEYVRDTGDTDITNITFINHAILRRANSKNKYIIRKDEIIENWLNEKSPSFRKRKNRLATKLAYHRAVLTYFVLLAQDSAKRL